MTGEIFIASKEVIVDGFDTGKRHLYLMYDPDGVTTGVGATADEQVIRGGPVTSAGTSTNGDLDVEAGVKIGVSQDAYTSSDPDPDSRGSTPLDLHGVDAATVWGEMVDFANSLGSTVSGATYSGGGDAVDTGHAYLGSGFNSNSVIDSVLSQVGISIETVYPLNPNTIDDHYASTNFPQGENLFGGSGNDTFLVTDGTTLIDGGAGTNTADFSHFTLGAYVNLTLSEFYLGTDNVGIGIASTISNIQNIKGTPYDDIVTGDGNNNIIDGGAGNDSISGEAGNDTIIVANMGTKTIDGGTGIDTLSFTGFSANSSAILPYAHSNSIYVDLTTGTFTTNVFDGSHGSIFSTGTLTGIENITGDGVTANVNYTQANFTGDSHDNIFDTKGGSNSSVIGEGGNDTVIWTQDYSSKLNVEDYALGATPEATNITIQLVGTTTSNIIGYVDDSSGVAPGTSLYLFTFTNQTDGQTYQSVASPAWMEVLIHDGSSITFKNPDSSTVSANSFAENILQDPYILIRDNLQNDAVQNIGIRGGEQGDSSGNNGGAAVAPPAFVSDVGTEFNGATHNYLSPIVIDMTGSGITTSSSTEVYLTTNVDGDKVASQWIGSNDAMLVIDKNGDGQISGIGEMLVTAVAHETDLTNAFSDLRSAYDTNSDGVIDSSDTQFSSFKIWLDANHDGIAQPGELQTLSAAGIQSIDLNSLTNHYSFVDGNEIVTQTGTVTLTDSSTLTMGDTWIEQDPQNTIATSTGISDLPPPDIYSLPELRGYGAINDLDVQMTHDVTLNFQVAALNDMTQAQVLDPSQLFTDKFVTMLYEWGGQTPDSWQQYSDSGNPQQVGFLDGIAGHIPTNYTWPGTSQTDGTWEKVVSNYEGNFLAQTVFQGLFTGTGVHYDLATGAFENATGLNSTFLSALESTISGSGHTVYDWALVVSTVDAVIGVSNLSTGDATALDNAIHTTDSSLTLSSLYTEINSTPVALTAADSSDTTLTGSFGDDTIIGLNGNDTLIGGAGDDHLYGGVGNDTYDPGTGYNYMSDLGGGDDTYIYGGGHDVIVDNSGTDQIQFASGITQSDISIERVNMLDHSSLNIYSGQTDLIVHVAGQGEIDIHSNYGSTSSIETLHFSDSSTIDLANLDNWVYGTSGNDTMTGADRSYYLNDRIDAGDGDNTLNGGLGHNQLNAGSGNDTYIYGGGVDLIHDAGGTDQIVFASTYDPAKFTFEFNPLQSAYDATTQGLNILYDGHVVATVDQALTNSDYFVESVVVTGVHTFDLTTIDHTINGTEGDDSLYGIQSSVWQNDTIYGHGGNDTIQGLAGNDYLNGGAGDDNLYGGDGDDTLNGGTGTNNLEGDAGANTYQFDTDALTATNTVYGFTPTNGDKLDLHDLLTGYTPGTSNINDFVHLTASGSNMILSVDVDGPGTGHTFQNIATLSGVSGLTVDDLLGNGHLTVTT